jgi:hypothetical protein
MKERTWEARFVLSSSRFAFAIMLPGNASETVYRRPPEAVGAAEGFEVSKDMTPFFCKSFRCN